MSRDKQIVEMADDIRRIRESYFGQADYLFAKKLYEDGYRKASDVAEEIFAEIEKNIDVELSIIQKIINAKGGRANGKTVLLAKTEMFIEAKKFIAELKKKYTEEGK